MKFIINDKQVNMYDGTNVAIMDTLPVGLYRLDFNPMSGHYLTRLDNVPKASKMYGDREKFLDRIERTYAQFDRSLGILLSGGKGIGKTMFSNHLIQRALEQGRPVVLVNEVTPGIDKTIDMLSEDTVVVFDEFEKRFSNDPDDDTQSNLLSLFDGQSAIKRLYIITVNDLSRVSSYFINRPGRFHYHLRFSNPKNDDVRDYMKDMAPSVSSKNVEKVVHYAELMDVTYDQLRAISWELEMGTPFEEILESINIPTEAQSQRYNVTITRNGESITEQMQLDPLTGGGHYVVLPGDDDSVAIRIGELKITNGTGTGQITNMDDIKSTMKGDEDFHGIPDKQVIITPYVYDYTSNLVEQL